VGQVGIDRVLAEVLPQDKAGEVKKLQGEGRKVAWWATASTTPRPWPRPTSASPWLGTDVAKESADIGS
jgi:Cu+-exporting ATPase